jgi:hypothetical protein
MLVMRLQNGEWRVHLTALYDEGEQDPVTGIVDLV